MKDIELVMHALHGATKDARLGEEDRRRARALFDMLGTAENNAAGERVTAEFRRGGELVLLTR